MENPFAETLRAFGVPMLGDDQRKAGQSGYGRPPLISSAPGILPPPDWSAYVRPPQPTPAASRPVPQQPRSALPARPLEQDWAAYAPKSQASSWLPEHLDLFPKEKLGGGDIFVGGGGDNLGKLFPWTGLGVMRDYANAYAEQTGRPTAYFSNDQVPDVVEAIRKANQTDGPVNLIGHSWGASDVYNAAVEAKRQGLRVDNVVTLDPVGGRGGLANPEGPPSGANWVNIAAASPGGTGGDIAAGIGGKPSKLPIRAAAEQLEAPAHHDDVEVMMARGGRQVLDRSRRVGGTIQDHLPISEWMRVRDSGAR